MRHRNIVRQSNTKQPIGRPSHRIMAKASSGFTLVELLVVIAIIGTLVALLLPAVQSARESARNNTCKNNIKQLATALANMDSSQGKFPGLVNALVDPNFPANGRRASWIVMCFPYMELSAEWDDWSKEFGRAPAAPSIEFLQCPSDAPEIPGQPSLSYVGNAGWGFSDTARNGSNFGKWRAPDPSDQESIGNGVFFDLSNTAAILSTAAQQDGRENSPDYPPIRSSISYVQSGDGTSKTMMISENLHAWYYAYDGNASSDAFDPGYDASSFKDISPIVDGKHVYGFIWKINRGQTDRINGDNNNDTFFPATMVEHANDLAFESLGYPSSNHPGGVNVAFVDGHITYIGENIDPTVYSRLMTSNQKRSKFYAPLNGTDTVDRDLPAMSDDDF